MDILWGHLICHPWAGRLLCIEWAEYPGMVRNPEFCDYGVLENLERSKAQSRIFFLCRSGVRSKGAAKAVAAAMTEQEFSCPCVNVLEGFEGDLDPEKKRGEP